MYNMLIDHPPFDGDIHIVVTKKHMNEIPMPPSQFNPTILTALEEMIMRCLEKAPDMRFRGGSQLARVLESLVY